MDKFGHNSNSNNNNNITDAMMATKFPNGEDYRHILRTFIQLYRDSPVLWDTSLRDYTNRDKRAEAYEKLVPIYRYLKRDATVEDVKKKINTLRTNYRKELKVVESARRNGTIHHPRCWTFLELDFLRNSEKFLSVYTNYKIESSFFNGHDDSQTQNSLADNSNYNFRTILGNSLQPPPPQPSASASASSSSSSSAAAAAVAAAAVHNIQPPSIAEMFQKCMPQRLATPMMLNSTGTGNAGTQECTSTQAQYHNCVSVSGSGTGIHGSHSGNHGIGISNLSSGGIEIKRQRLSPSISNTSNDDAAATAAAITSAQNADDLLNIACDYLSGTFPEEESIARTWTHKLKRMQRDQRLLAEKFINEILFEGESGTLHRGSVQVNCFPLPLPSSSSYPNHSSGGERYDAADQNQNPNPHHHHHHHPHSHHNHQSLQQHHHHHTTQQNQPQQQQNDSQNHIKSQSPSIHTSTNVIMQDDNVVVVRGAGEADSGISANDARNCSSSSNMVTLVGNSGTGGVDANNVSGSSGGSSVSNNDRGGGGIVTGLGGSGSGGGAGGL